MSDPESSSHGGLARRLAGLAVARPVSVAMLCAAVGLLGWLSLDRLGVELLPDVAAPKILVRVDSGDRSPEDMEETFARTVEGILSTVRGVRQVSSVSRVGRTLVVATFPWGSDMDRALLDVQKAVAQIGSDREVDDLLVLRYDPSAAPILVLGLRPTSPEMDLAALRRLGEDVARPALEGLDGVALARVSGGEETEMVVEPDAHLLEAYGLTPTDLASRIQAANVDASGGTVEDSGRVYLVKGLGRVRGPEQLREITVAQRGSQGALEPVRLEEVARVEERPKERKSIVLLDGGEGVALSVFKEAGANTVLVSRGVREALDRINDGLVGARLEIVREQARFIRQAIGEVGEAAIVGAVLAFLVLWIFLRRTGPTLVVGAAIPVSVVATFVLMYFSGLSLNIMTLGGLALGAGMLVDNAIVVMESIFRRRESGEGGREAAADGTGEVGTAISASTLTSCVVFLPVVFLSGMAAELFQEQALVVTYSLLCSLAAALVVVPTLAARLVPGVAGREAAPVPGAEAFERSLRWLLRRKWLVAAGGAALLALQVPLFVHVGTEFLPRAQAGEFSLQMEMPAGTRVEATSRVAGVVMEKVREAAGEDLQHLVADVGEVEEDAWLRTEEVPGEESATLHVVLKEGARTTPDSIAKAMRPFLEKVPGLEFRWDLGEASLMEGIGADTSRIEIEVRGPDLDVLRRLTDDVAARARALGPQVLTVVTSFQDLREEIRLVPDRALLAAVGLDLAGLADRVRRRVEGEDVSTYRAAEGERDIAIRFPQRRADELRALELDTPSGARVHLGDLVRLQPDLAPREVLRRGQSRVGLIQVGLTPEADYPATAARLDSALAGVHLPGGYRIQVGGEELQRQESFQELRLALVLALVLVYMVLASLFESFVHPFTILLSVPLAGFGVAVAFTLWGRPLSAMALIGVVFLAGIAVNDTVLLVDYAGQRRRAGTPREEAVVQAARVRLRPILMTSITTIAALVPLALGWGAGASLRAPLAVAIIGGLVASTVLTLVVLPSVYLLLDDLRPRRMREEARAGSPAGDI